MRDYYLYTNDPIPYNIVDGPVIKKGDRLAIDTEDGGFKEFEVLGISHEFIERGEYLDYKTTRLHLNLKGDLKWK